MSFTEFFLFCLMDLSQGQVKSWNCVSISLCKWGCDDQRRWDNPCYLYFFFSLTALFSNTATVAQNSTIVQATKMWRELYLPGHKKQEGNSPSGMENIRKCQRRKSWKKHLLIMNEALHKVPDSSPSCTRAEQTQISIERLWELNNPSLRLNAEWYM